MKPQWQKTINVNKDCVA